MLRRPLAALTGFSGHLAMLNTRARTIRLAGAVLPVMLATGLATSLIYLQTNQDGGDERAFTDNLRADLVVTSATGGLPLSLVDSLRSVPGVASVSAYASSTAFIEPLPSPEPRGGGDAHDRPDASELPVFGVSPQGVDGTTAVRVLTGSLAGLSGDTIALPGTALAGRRLGDLVPTRLGDGTLVGLRLVATVSAQRGYAAALVPAPLLVAHTTDGRIPQILVRAAPGTDTARLAGALSALSTPQLALRVAGRDQVTADHRDDDRTQAWMSYLLVLMVVGYAAIALVNTQVMATAERRREFSLQRLLGATHGQVLRMMTVESLLVALTGILLGLLVSAATLVPLSLNILGSPLPTGPWWVFALVLTGATALTLATTLLSTALALRSRPAEALTGRD